MAEDGSGGGSWWGGWVQAAKEKTSNAYEFMKHDLAEFTSTVSTETVSVAQTMKTKITQENVSAATAKAKQGVSSIIGGISKALVIEAEDINDPGIPITKDGVFDRKKARLRAIQLDSGTYLNEPTGSPEQFEMWLPSFDLDSKKGDISELLVANVEVRALYTQLVPSTVSHASFWQRYFYKVHQLEQDEQRKLMLMKRADDTTQDELAWDDDEDFIDVAASSPPKSSSLTHPEEPTITPPKNTTNDNQPDNQVSTQPDNSQSSENTSQDTNNPDDRTNPEISNLEVMTGNNNLDSPTELSEDKTPDDHDTTQQQQHQDITSSTASTLVSSQTTSSIEESPSVEVISESEAKEAKEVKSDSEVELKGLKTKERGELVVVGNASDRTTPSSESQASSKDKESSGVDDDWEQDFDIEVSEEDLKMLGDPRNKKLLEEIDDQADDWENWE